jgi:hypothetical protein
LLPENLFLNLPESLFHAGNNLDVYEDLKAVFLVKDFHGNKDRTDTYNDFLLWGSKKVKARFIDGEEITGYALHYSLDGIGFFIDPADRQSNNRRIFVINSAIKDVMFL